MSSDSSLASELETAPVDLDGLQPSQVVGSSGRSLLARYLCQAKRENTPLQIALNRWRAKACFLTPTARACCELLHLMGQPPELVFSDVLNILSSRLQVQIDNMPSLSSLQGTQLKQAVFLVMEESVNFLSMQQLRPSIVVLLIKVFDTLRHEKCFHAFLTSCPKSDFRADLSSFVRLSHSFLFTHPSVEVTSLSHPQHEALLPVWGRIVAIIFRDALQEDNPELLHYCRHTSPLAFQCLLWPAACDWLVEEIVEHLCHCFLETHSINLERLAAKAVQYLDATSLDSLDHLNTGLAQLVSLVSMSSFSYSLFSMVLEYLYLSQFHRDNGIRNSNTTVKQPPKVSITATDARVAAWENILSGKRFRQMDMRNAQNVEYLLPSVRIAVVQRLVEKEGASFASKIDPVTYNLTIVMERLLTAIVKKKQRHFDSWIQTPSSSTACTVAPSTPVSENSPDLEGCLVQLREFTVKTFSELLTVSFILCHPPYIQTLAELFVESQIIDQQTVIGTWSSSSKATDFFIGLIILGLSFPALHAAAVATLEVTADSDAGSREKRTRLPTDTFNRTSRLASKRRRCPSSTDSVNLMLRHPSVASFSGVADGQHYVVSHDGSAQSLLSSNAGGATLGQIATQIRFAGSPADSAANASSTMRSCCTHSLLLRELRRCALHLRPATEQYLDVLKQLLSSYVDNIDDERNHGVWWPHSRASGPGVATRATSLTGTQRFSTYDGLNVWGSTSQASPSLREHERCLSLYLDAFRRVSSTCFPALSSVSMEPPTPPLPSFKLASSAPAVSEKEQLGVTLRRRRRYALDRRLLIMIVLGIISCGCRFTHITDLLEWSVNLLCDALNSGNYYSTELATGAVLALVAPKMTCGPRSLNVRTLESGAPPQLMEQLYRFVRRKLVLPDTVLEAIEQYCNSNNNFLLPSSSSPKKIQDDAFIYQTSLSSPVGSCMFLSWDAWLRFHAALYLLRPKVSTVSHSSKPESKRSTEVNLSSRPVIDVTSSPDVQESSSTPLPKPFHLKDFDVYGTQLESNVFHAVLERIPSLRDAARSTVERRFFSALIHDIRQFIAHTSSKQGNCVICRLLLAIWVFASQHHNFHFKNSAGVFGTSKLYCAEIISYFKSPPHYSLSSLSLTTTPQDCPIVLKQLHQHLRPCQVLPNASQNVLNYLDRVL